MKAALYNYRQSPRKVRLVGSLIKGMSVANAELELSFLAKRAALPFLKLLQSAVANAESQGNDKKTLMIADVRVDKGVTMKRSMPRARGSAYPINKRSSHVIITLREKAPEKAQKPITKKADKPTSK